MKEISRFFSDDRLKEAVVCSDEDKHFIRFYNNGVLVGEQFIDNKSHHFAEDVAENYTSGILEFK